jgi:hypothetical protein
LGSNQLTGEIPPEIGNLTKLTFLDLGINQLSGDIPLEFYNLKKLRDVWLHMNDLTGEIDPQIGGLTDLIQFYVDGNKLTGIIPTEICNLTSLEILNLSYNQFKGNIPDAINTISSLEYLGIRDNYFDEIPDLSSVDSIFCSINKLTFEDFERNLIAINSQTTFFDYSPQRLFGRAYDTTAYEGAPFTLSIPCGGIYNHYTWFKENQLMKPNDFSKLTFSAIQQSDTGSYYITVINDLVPDLTLQSYPVRIKLFNKPTLITSNCDLINQPLSLTVAWNVAAWADSYALQVSTSPDFSSLVIDQSGIKTTNYVVSGLEHGTKYYWRVNASDSLGTTGWSEVCNFTTLPEIPDIPLLESPDSASVVQSISLPLSWFSSERAESYTIQISTSPDFSGTVIEQSEITSTSYPISGLGFETTYYWRVSATNITGTSGWSTVWNFTTYQPKIELINLVIIDGVHSPIFWIGGIEFFPDNKLVVYTKWGKRIYTKNHYSNDLDFSSYPAGTYYYVLTVNMKEGPKQFKSFVDVVKE